MLTPARAFSLAPSHWLNWLTHHSVADDLRRLLLKLRLATPLTLDDDLKIHNLVQMIARAETDEQASLRALAAIEDQYRQDKKSKRLRQTSLPNTQAPQRHDLTWLLSFMLFLSNNRSSRG